MSVLRKKLQMQYSVVISLYLTNFLVIGQWRVDMRFEHGILEVPIGRVNSEQSKI
jgi:hypothetical protein